MIEANRIAAAQRCLYGSAEHCCGQPATVHVLQINGSPTMDCDLHVSHWLNDKHVDMHPISGACGLPGTTWTPSGCIVEGLDVK